MACVEARQALALIAVFSCYGFHVVIAMQFVAVIGLLLLTAAYAEQISYFVTILAGGQGVAGSSDGVGTLAFMTPNGNSLGPLEQIDSFLLVVSYM